MNPTMKPKRKAKGSQKGNEIQKAKDEKTEKQER